MSRPAILVSPPIPPELRRTLEERFELVEHKRGERRPGFEVLVITSVGGADAALMDEIPDLRLIACNGTGLERVSLPDAGGRNVIVRNTPDEVTDDTADFAVALVYATARRLAEADRFVRSGRWKSERLSPSVRAVGQRVGIVGLGKIGQKIASRLSGAGMQVSYTGPRRKPDQPYRYVPNIKDLAAESSTLVLSCPGGPETRHIVDAEVLRALGPDGALVNVSRGEVVHEESLIQALQNKAIRAAGLDVFENEPDIDSRFFELENVVLAPHYAAVTQDTRLAIATTLRDAISDFMAGRSVPDAAAAYRPAPGLH